MSENEEKSASAERSQPGQDASASEALLALMRQVACGDVSPEIATAKVSKFVVQLVEHTNGLVDSAGLVAEARKDEKGCIKRALEEAARGYDDLATRYPIPRVVTPDYKAKSAALRRFAEVFL